MDFFQNITLGFSVALGLENILFCFLGVLLGTLVGVLPGIGVSATIALLLPITYNLDATTAIIMLAGIYYGAQYGGSTTAILVNLPGEASAIVTCIDGHQMAKQGRAGAALAIAAIGSLFAGTIGTLLLATVAPMLALVALAFGTPEYFALMVLGLVCSIVIAHGDLAKAFASMFLGLLLGFIGTDFQTGTLRYTFGVRELMDGLDFVPLALAIFGIADIIINLEKERSSPRSTVISNVGRLWPTAEELRAAFPAMLRGTGIGSLLGILPGGGATLSSFMSYMVEKRIAKDPSRFGKGAIEGLAGPESANNAAAQTNFIPLLTLGIPGGAVMALILAALMMQGIVPGPRIIQDQPSLFWGVVASMFIGNLLLVVINLPLVGVWVKLLNVPYKYLFPFILVICCIGTYSLKYSVLDIYVLSAFAAIGYIFTRLGCEMVPFLLAFILGPLMEENLKRSLLLSDGDFSVFLSRPLTLSLLIFSLLLLLLAILPKTRKQRDTIFQEDP